MTVRINEPLACYNTLALPACASAFFEIFLPSDWQRALNYARELQLPILPLGQGSNVVFAGDPGALVVRVATRGIDIVREDEHSVTLRVAAGEDWHTFVQWTLARGYFGLENLALIPGTVGAAPLQNIGAYGVEVNSVVEQVRALHIESGDAVTLANEACEFSYRDSVFKRRLRDRMLITAVDFQLSREPRVNISYPALRAQFDNSAPSPGEVFDTVVALRRSKLPDPAQQPNVGSFFKNPIVENQFAVHLAKHFSGLPIFEHANGLSKLAAAWLIQRCGFKGARRGDVGVHAKHALVLVNYRDGTGQAILDLAREIQDSVQSAFDVRLELEPRVYGARSGVEIE